MAVTIREIPVEEINAAPYNPRQTLAPGDREYETVKGSLREFGLVEPLVWNKRTGHLVSGHLRLRILKDRGDAVVTCSVVDLPAEKEKALNVTLNNPAVGGRWDPTGLTALLEELEASVPDLYDELAMRQLAALDLPALDGDGEKEEEEKKGPEAMELLPYEHYDYIVLFFRDSRDFMAAGDHFKIDVRSVPAFVGKKKIGLGRVIDGARYLASIQDKPSAAAADVGLGGATDLAAAATAQPAKAKKKGKKK